MRRHRVVHQHIGRHGVRRRGRSAQPRQGEASTELRITSLASAVNRPTQQPYSAWRVADYEEENAKVRIEQLEGGADTVSGEVIEGAVVCWQLGSAGTLDQLRFAHW